MVKKQSYISTILLTGLALLTAISCEVGLGASVDTEAPTLDITYPPASAVIRGTFTLAGTCGDDKGVSGIAITIRNVSTNATASYSLGSEETSWSQSINAYDTSAYSSTNGWQFPDGKYEISAVASDAAGHSSGTASRTIEIDNTAPLFIMKSPGSSDSANPTAYGTVFKVNGSISEDHMVSTMAVTVYNTSGTVLAGTDSAPFTETNIITAGGTSVIVAQYSAAAPSSTLSSRYTAVYGTDISAKETRSYYCSVTLTDNAKSYTAPAETENTTTGNATNVFYLADDVASLTTSYSVDDLKSIVNGTVSSDARSSIISTLSGSAKTRAAFSLNPDKAPRYTISSLKFTGTTTENLAGAGGKIVVAVTAGLNATYINPATLSVYQFGPYTAIPSTLASLYSDPASYAAANPTRATLLKNESGATSNSSYSAGSVESYNYQVLLSDTIRGNSYYIIAATGTDVSGESIIPDSGYYFGFKGQVTGTPPTLTLGAEDAGTYTNIANLGVIKTSTLKFSGSASASSPYTVESVSYSTEVKDESSSAAVGSFTGSAVASDGAFDAQTETWTGDLSTATGYIPAPAGVEYLYTTTFTVTDNNNGNSSSNITRTIHVDTKSPDAEITSVTPTVTKDSNTCVNGTITVKGTAADTNMGTITLTAKDTVDHTTPVLVYTGSSYSFRQTVDTTKYGGTLTLTLTAVDKAGNTTTVFKTYTVDQTTDAPVITLNNVNTAITDSAGIGTAYTGGAPQNNIFNQSGNNTIIGTITDDDGVGTVTLTYVKDGTPYATHTYTPNTTPFSLQDALKKDSAAFPQGEYAVTITVKNTAQDETGYSSASASFLIAVDNGAPVFSSVTNLTGSYYKKGASFNITGKVTDGSGTADITARHTLSGIAHTLTQPTAADIPAGASWSDAVTIPDTASDGDHTATYTATDKYGQTTTSEAVAYTVDSTSPLIGSTFSVDSNWKNNTVQTLSVPVYDALSGIKSVTYAVNSGTAYTLTPDGTTDISGVTYRFYTGTLNLASGANTVNITVTDNAGNTTARQVTYNIDVAKPDVSALINKTTSTGNTPVTVKGTSTDTLSGTKSLTLYEKIGTNSELIEANNDTTPSDNSEYSNTFTVPTARLTDGTHTFFVTAADNAGNTADSDALQVTVDTAAPTLVVSNLANDALYTESDVTESGGTHTYKVTGTWYDATSGTAKLQYTTSSTPGSVTDESDNAADAGTKWVTVSGTTPSAGVTLSWTAPIAVTEGINKTISFRAKDGYGNTTAGDAHSFTGLKFDFAVPTLTMNTPPAYLNAASTTLTLTQSALGDTDGLDSVVVTAQKDGVTIASGAEHSGYSYTTSIDTDKHAGTVTISLTGNEYNNGTWTFTVTATDIAGRTTTVSGLSTIIDTVAPAVKNDGSYAVKINNTAYNEASWYKATALPLSGYYTENGSGIASVYYWLNPQSLNASDVNTATGSFSTSPTNGDACKYDATIAGFTTGTNTLYIEAKDAAGNLSGATSYTVKVDMTAPTITPSSLTSKLTNLTSAITLTGTAADEQNGSGVKSIEVTVNGNKIAATTKETDKSAIVGTTSWTLTIDNDVLEALKNVNASGVYAVTATVTDNAGNATTAQIGSLLIDTTAPAAAIKSPSAAAAVNGTHDMTGTVTEANSPKSIALYYATTADASLSNWTLFKMITTDSGTSDDKHTYGASVSDIYAWTLAGFDFNTASGAASATGGTGTVYVLPVAYDDAGNCNINTAAVSSSDYKTYAVDMNGDRPVIRIADLAANPGVLKNGTNATISGTITDDDAGDAVVPLFLASHVQITASSLSGSDISATLSGISDPVTFTGSTADGVTTWTNATYGTTTLNKATGEWTYTPADTGDGSKNVYFFVSDNKNTSFYTGQGTTKLFRPYVQFKSAAKGSNDSVITYKSDSISPRFSAVTVDYGSTTAASDATGVSLSASLTVGGTARRYVKFVAGAYDENNIEKMTLKAVASDGTVIKDPAATYTTSFTTSEYNAGSKTYTLYTWTTDAVDLSTFATGAVTVTVTTYDTCGLSNISTNTFTLDNKGPSITVSSPSASDEVTGTVTLSGISADNGGSTTETTQFAVPTLTQVAAGYTDSQLASTLTWGGTLASGKSAGVWGFTFDGSANSLLTAYDGGDYSTESNGIYTIPVYLKSTDALGNCTIHKHALKHNPDADKPVTTILYPSDADYDSGETYVTLGGTIRMNGSVTIPSGTTSVKAVYIQIADSTGSFSDTDKTTASGTYGYTVLDYSGAGITAGWTASMTQAAWWGIAATRTASTWYINLNSAGKMDPSSGTNDIMLRACAVNADGKVGAWSSAYSVHIDKNAPTATAVVNQYSVSGADVVGATPTAGQSYTSGMYLKGSWYLVVTVSDESGIVTDTSNTNTLSVLENSTALTRGSGYYLSSEFTKDSKKGYYVYIPVSTASGTVTYTVKATDTDGSGAHTIEPTFTLKIDNTAPTLSAFKGNGTAITAATAIQNNNYVYTVSGTVTDNDGGSGFARAAFYFYRPNVKTSGNECIFDPMLTSAYNASDKRAPLSSLTSDSVADGINLYGVTLAVSQTSTTTLTADDVPNNSHIRQGGLIKIDGIYHKIQTLSGKTITLDSETSDTSSTTAFFPYAQVADNTSTETRTSELSAGSFTITNDDGDGMPETVTQTGSTYDWNATIYSNNMPDGPVTIVCVIFDKAGNVTGTSVSTRITNNAPRLAKVHFGTDLNGNGSYSSNEFTTYNIKTQTGSYSSAATVSTAAYAGSAFVIKDTLAVVPEFTGGNGTIGMVYKKGATDTTAVAGTVQAAAGSVVAEGDSATVLGNSFAKETKNSLYAYTLANETVSPASTDDGTGKGMSFTFWDSTEETTPGTDSLNCVLYVNDFTVQIHDVTKPAATVRPFYWTSATDSSVYTTLSGTAGVNGHIELPADLDTTKFSQPSGEYDTDPKVSGYIRIQGTASDNTRLRTISVSLDDFTITPYSVYDVTGGEQSRSQVGYLAVYVPSQGGWVISTPSDGAAADLKDDGWTFSVTDASGPTQSGHSVTWELDIDTSRITNIAGLDKTITATATDKGDLTPETAGTLRVDVVPYVTSVKTSLYTKSSSNWSVFTRTSLGHYSVRESESVVINGYNFATYNTPTVKLGSTALDVSAKTATAVTAGIGTAAASGALALTVNNGTSTIDALNNVNTNTKAYNMQPNGVNNDLLTDDLTFDVWQFKTIAKPTVSALKSGTVKVSPKDGKIGASFSNFMFFNMAGVNSSGTYQTQTPFMLGYNGCGDNTFAFDKNGYTYGAVQYQSNNSQAESGFFHLFLGRAQAVGDMTPEDGYLCNPGSARLEPNAINMLKSPTAASKTSEWITNLYRITSPSIVPVADSTSENVTVHIAYCDRTTHQIRYRKGIVNSNSFVTNGSTNANGLTAFKQYSSDSSLEGSSLRDIFDFNVADYTGSSASTYTGKTFTYTGGIQEAVAAPSYPYLGTYNTKQDATRNICPPDSLQTMSGQQIHVIASSGVSDTTLQNVYQKSTTDHTYANGAGDYCALSVITISGTEYVIIAWQDSDTGTLKYTYRTSSSIDAESSTTAWYTRTSAWEANTTTIGNGGAYVQMVADSDNHLHLAYYDETSGDLKYTYIETLGSAGVTTTVDSYADTGEHCTLTVGKDAGGNQIPYIGYYSNKLAKVAYRLSGTSADAGAVNDKFTGNWSISYVPSAASVSEDTVSAAMYVSGGVLTAIPKQTESTIDLSNGKSTPGYSSLVGGNGTLNPAVAYITKDGLFEMAQMK